MNVKPTMTLLVFWCVLLSTGCAALGIKINGKPVGFGSDDATKNAAPKTATTKNSGSAASKNTKPEDLPRTPSSVDPASKHVVFETEFFKFNATSGKDGWRSMCDVYGRTTKEPAATINLVSVPDDLIARVNLGGVLVRDGVATCVSSGLLEMDWKPGKYDYYPISSRLAGSMYAARFEFLSVGQVQSQVNSALANKTVKLPMATNPMYTSIAPSKIRVNPHDVGLTCVSSKKGSPVSHLKLKSTGILDFTATEGTPVVLTEDGECRMSGEMVPAGKHQLWVVGDNMGGAKDTEFAVLERDQPYKFAKREVVRPGKRADVVNFDLQPVVARHPAICGNGSRQPNFYVKKSTKFASEMRVTQGYGDLKFTVVGPLEKTKKKNTCKSWKSIPGVKGTYAVFVNHENKEVRKASAVIGDRNSISLVKQTRRPSSVVPIQDREVLNYYANYPKHKFPAEVLYNTAPRQLFVYLKSSSNGIAANTPLLLLWHGEKRSRAILPDGKFADIPTSSLSEKAPASINVYVSSKIERPEDFDELNAISGANQEALMRKHSEKVYRFGECTEDYMMKHDPSFGKGYGLVNTRTGETTEDITYRKAAKKCGESALTRSANKLMKAVYQSRLKDQKKYNASFGKRF